MKFRHRHELPCEIFLHLLEIEPLRSPFAHPILPRQQIFSLIGIELLDLGRRQPTCLDAVLISHNAAAVIGREHPFATYQPLDKPLRQGHLPHELDPMFPIVAKVVDVEAFLTGLLEVGLELDTCCRGDVGLLLQRLMTGDALAIEIRFNSRIDAARSHLKLYRIDGGVVSLPLTDAGADDMLKASASSLAPGRYRLHWQTLSPDGHISQGDIPFGVTPR